VRLGDVSSVFAPTSGKIFRIRGRARHCPPYPKSISRRGFGFCNPVGSFATAPIFFEDVFVSGGVFSKPGSVSRRNEKVRPAHSENREHVFKRKRSLEAGFSFLCGMKKTNWLMWLTGSFFFVRRKSENGYKRTCTLAHVNPASRERVHSHTCPRFPPCAGRTIVASASFLPLLW